MSRPNQDTDKRVAERIRKEARFYRPTKTILCEAADRIEELEAKLDAVRAIEPINVVPTEGRDGLTLWYLPPLNVEEGEDLFIKFSDLQEALQEKQMSERIIEAHLTVRDEEGEIIGGFSEYRLTMTCPDDWDDGRVREELDSITDATESIFGAS